MIGISTRLVLLAQLAAGAAALVVAPSSASAAPQAEVAPTDDARREAKASFTLGEQAFATGDARAALAHFERAFALVAHDAVRFNIAVCLEALGRNVEALEQYRAASASRVLSADERARAERAAREASARVGAVRVDGGSGAAVVIAGRSRCASPCRVELDPGTYEVVVATTPERRVHVDVRAGSDAVVDASPRTPAPPLVPVVPPANEPTFEPGWLTWTGAGIGALGAAGIVGFGLRAESLHDDYEREPTRDRLEDGESARDLANVAIGVAAAGAVLVAIDLVFFAPRDVASPRSAQLIW